MCHVAQSGFRWQLASVDCLQKPSAFDADVTDDDKSEDGPTVGRRLRNQENVSPPRVAWRADMTEDETGPSSDVSEVMHGSPRASRGRKPRREANASVCESSFGGDGLEGAELMSEDAFMESWGRIARSGDALDKVRLTSPLPSSVIDPASSRVTHPSASRARQPDETSLLPEPLLRLHSACSTPRSPPS